MKQRKSRNLILLMVLLVALIAVYFVIHHNNQKAQEAEEATSSEQVLNLEASEVESIQFTLDGQQVSFTKTDDTWKLEGDDTFAVEGSAVENAISAVAGMTSERTLENVEDLAEYGLEQPVQTVVLKTKDGVTHSIYFGNSNDSTGNDYVYIDDDSTKVYTIGSSVAQTFSGTLEDYRVVEEESTEDSEEAVDVTEEATEETTEAPDEMEESTEATETD